MNVSLISNNVKSTHKDGCDVCGLLHGVQCYANTDLRCYVMDCPSLLPVPFIAELRYVLVVI